MALNCSKVQNGLSGVRIWAVLRDNLLFANNSAMFELTNAKKTGILRQTSVPTFWIQLLRLLLVVPKGSCRSNLVIFFVARIYLILCRSQPKNETHRQKESWSWSRLREGLGGNWLQPPILDRSSCFHGSILLLWIIGHLEVMCFLDMNQDNPILSTPLSATVFMKPASEHRLINRRSSED